MTRRWSFSVTGNILEQLTDRGGSVDVVFLQQFGKPSGKVRRKLIQRFEQRQKKLVRAWSMQWLLLTSDIGSGASAGAQPVFVPS
jgi:hypothetical protein